MILFHWFENNQMQGNADECHVLLSTEEKYYTNINGALIQNSKQENFKHHINSLYSKARLKVKCPV